MIHPQSVVHSLVEYLDGSVLAQLGAPDMRIPIAYTLAWPERMETPCERLDLAEIGELISRRPTWSASRRSASPAQALREGGAEPAMLNAANEVAVAAFLAGGIGFPRYRFHRSAKSLHCYAIRRRRPPSTRCSTSIARPRAGGRDIVRKYAH